MKSNLQHAIERVERPGGSHEGVGAEKTVEIAWGELRWEGARQHAGWRGNHGNSLGELRWEGARQDAGRRGNRGNSLRRASLGGSETACWTDGRKPWK